MSQGKTNDSANNNANDSGKAAEILSAQFLERQGLSIVARNFRCRGGEIDLICRDRAVLVFVEVRLRSNARFGGAGASITAHKQRRIILAAEHYLATQSNPECACRFDCILLDALDQQRIEWLKDAFSAN
ncbi:MAG: YraN family protein [Pseudomonadota bacterium]